MAARTQTRILILRRIWTIVTFIVVVVEGRKDSLLKVGQWRSLTAELIRINFVEIINALNYTLAIRFKLSASRCPR